MILPPRGPVVNTYEGMMRYCCKDYGHPCLSEIFGRNRGVGKEAAPEANKANLAKVTAANLNKCGSQQFAK